MKKNEVLISSPSPYMAKRNEKLERNKRRLLTLCLICDLRQQELGLNKNGGQIWQNKGGNEDSYNLCDALEDGLSDNSGDS